VPTFVKGLIDKKIIMASCGAKHMMALTEENQIFVWGTGENGRLGLGDTKGRNVPTVVDQLINQ
jgi:alpha-tubulin suppressor-like RCC1 family protein